MAKEKEKQTTKTVEKTAYKVVVEFMDKFNSSILYKVGQEVPADFTEDRIKDLLDRKLIK